MSLQFLRVPFLLTGLIGDQIDLTIIDPLQVQNFVVLPNVKAVRQVFDGACRFERHGISRIPKAVAGVEMGFDGG